MASGNTWTNICLECGRHVEILNGDVQFSMELHKQSHKSLDFVNNVIDKNLSHLSEKVSNAAKLKMNFCQDCKESFEIINNDLSLSFQLHSERHKKVKTNAGNHSSSSTRQKKEFIKVTEEKQPPQPAVTTILDALFHTMPMGLKAHRSFICEQGCSKAMCNLCEITIEPVFSLIEHLKTKQHEDNTITVIKAMFSSELHDQMEFVSFYGSNLCCNLCRCKIDLCSENLHKTAMNIVIHNAEERHSSNRTTKEDGPNKTLLILKSLAHIDPLIKDNQHLVEYNMSPYFKCKPCDKHIAYSENHAEIIKNFTQHFTSAAHIKHLSALTLLTKWKDLKIPGKENHNFVVIKKTINCLSCKCNVEANLDKLLAHVKVNSSKHETMEEANLTSRSESAYPKFNDTPDRCLSGEKTIISPLNQKFSSLSLSEQRLFQCLPVQFKHMLQFSAKGEAMCSVCKCIIPSTIHNLTTHFNGSSHKKKENKEKLPFEKNKGTSDSIDTDLGRREFQSTCVIEEYFLSYGEENKYICVLCSTIYQEDLNLIKNILSHNQTKSHLTKVEVKNEMWQLLPICHDDLVKKLFYFVPMCFQKDSKYFMAAEGTNFIFCQMCYVKIPNQTAALVKHLESNSHKTSVERFEKIQFKNLGMFGSKSIVFFDLLQELIMSHPIIKKNAVFLDKSNEDYICKLCKAIMKNSYDKNLLETNILSHLNGEKHTKNLLRTFSRLDRTE